MSIRPAGRVTRKDVARLAGTSVAVVSYVINDGPRPVARATRERVLAAIAEIDYRPNGIAKALAAGATHTYGLVIPDISNPFFAQMAHALEDVAFASGRVLLLGDAAESREREHDIINNFLQRQVEGLLYIGVDNHAQVDMVAGTGTPVVVLDRVSDASPTSSVVVDNVAGARAATSHLIEHGYTSIGLLGGPDRLSTSHDRHEGWAQALQEAGLPIRPDWILSGEFSKASGLELGRRLVSLPERPRAVFAGNDQQAVGLLRAAAEAHISVPEDLAVITFDGTEDSAYSIPPLSTIRQPIEEIARAAIGLLLNPHDYESNRITCEFELVLRRSCGCPEKT
jgi:LacI family transcriptional regulator